MTTYTRTGRVSGRRIRLKSSNVPERARFPAWPTLRAWSLAGALDQAVVEGEDHGRGPVA
jgi:hypothetical protein